MSNLNFYDTEAIDELAWPEQDTMLTSNSPALDFFTDFNEVKPLVIEAQTSADEALQLMQKSHVRLKFVVDAENHFIGVVALEDLNNQEIVKKLSQGFNRQDLQVTDFMKPKEQLKAFDYREIAKARVRDIVDVLQHSGQQHCLVIDRETHRIRGIFSASDISRKLHLPIDITNRASFYNVYSAVRQS